jgi:hypothetical protein
MKSNIAIDENFKISPKAFKQMSKTKTNQIVI